MKSSQLFLNRPYIVDEPVLELVHHDVMFIGVHFYRGEIVRGALLGMCLLPPIYDTIILVRFFLLGQLRQMTYFGC
jgi:hypothetical protein